MYQFIIGLSLIFIFYKKEHAIKQHTTETYTMHYMHGNMELKKINCTALYQIKQTTTNLFSTPQDCIIKISSANRNFMLYN